MDKQVKKVLARIVFELEFKSFDLNLNDNIIDFSSLKCRIANKTVKYRKDSDKEDQYLLDLLLEKIEDCTFLETVESKNSYGYIDLLLPHKDPSTLQSSIIFFLTEKHSTEFTLLFQNQLLSKNLTLEITKNQIDEFKKIIVTLPNESRIYLDNITSFTFKKIDN